MPKQWYCIEHHGLNEVGSYTLAEGITDFPRGTYLAYGRCCLVTGFKTEQEAKEGLKKYPCTQNSHV